MTTTPELQRLLPERAFVVSCQAREGSPLRHTPTIARLAEAAVTAGAHGIRANGVDDVAEIRRRVEVPIIGIAKRAYEHSEVYITPTMADAALLVDAGCEIVAVDGTDRRRPAEDLATLVAGIHERGALVMADVDTAENGRFAAAAGADLVASTLAGYTDAPSTVGPDLDLVEQLADTTARPVVAEGRYWVPEEVAAAYERGARAVVVGSAITSPERIVHRFLKASR